MRENWKSNTGFILATIGCAVGLGNLWQFPYLAGTNGGGAFVCIYILIVIILGISLIIAEQAIGRHTGQSPIGAYRKIAPKFVFNGYLGVIANVLLLSFYGVVGGWVMSYFFSAIFNPSFHTPENFKVITQSPLLLLGSQLTFVGATTLFVIRGVNKGIERANRIMMPLLFIILLALAIRSLTLPGAMKGVQFLLKPDFSNITPTTVVSAMGQAFFSLSLGIGTIVTYSSYLSKNSNIVKSGWIIAIADTSVAILAGLAIFPAIFSFGMEPASGPGLLFIVIPQIFNQLPFGHLLSILFFTLLLFASLSSSISMLEVPTAFLVDEFHFRRRSATLSAVSISMIIGIFCALSTTDLLNHFTLFGKNIFDAVVYLSNNVMLPIGGIFLCIITGWVWGLKNAEKEITNDGKIKFYLSFCWGFIIRYVAPIAIFLILLSTITE